VSKPKSRFKLVVNRGERVAATPETVLKARGCVIRKLYEAQAIDGQEQDAALEIVEAFTFITSAIGIRPLLLDGLDKGRSDLNERACRLWDQYLRWGRELVRRRHIRPHLVVEWLLMERHLTDRGEVDLLVGSLRDWGNAKTA
jgi:hypothetical protein